MSNESEGRLDSQHPADRDVMQPGLSAYPPKERWNDWTELDSRAWPDKKERKYSLVPTSCFNCESACGLLAYVDQETEEIKKFEGNPLHPGSRGRNCAKGPATLNQINDPDRILYPMKRKGERGGGEWERVSWDDALDDIAARIRKALVEGRKQEIMYHVGRPGEDGYTNRVLQAWGVDGHNSHTNICSAGARAGYAFWMGIDRPSPDFANARTILLVSAHLESGHYFNPHAQRILEAKKRGARLIVFDPRLSNTATHADMWLPTYPGTEPAIFLAIANLLLQEDRFNREFVRRWVNWEEFLGALYPKDEVTFENFVRRLKETYAEYTLEWAEQESGIPADTIVQVKDAIADAGTAFSAHNWRASGAGNLHGWLTARCLFFLNVLTGSVGTRGGTTPNKFNKFVPKAPTSPPPPDHWNELSWPKEFPLAYFEMSFLLPHLLKEGRGRLDMYFTRVYNPVWTNPDGFSWMEVLRDESLIGCHAALTPVWSETAFFADYVLPVGLGSERHDLHSYETHSSRWIGFRQPVIRAFRNMMGRPVTDTREVNPGEVWEENELWIDLSWRIDPDGSLGIRKHFESPYRPGAKITVDEYYQWIFENAVPGLPEAAEAEGLSPLAYMRRYGAFEVARDVYQTHDTVVEQAEYEGGSVDRETGVTKDTGGRSVGVLIDGSIHQGFPTPSRKLEIFSSTLADWGWPHLAIPTYAKSHVATSELDTSRNEMCLIPTFRIPVMIHTRSANAKWLNEIAHTNPLWLNPDDAARLRVATGDLIRVNTATGYYVLPAWVTEGIRPGVVACSHHMGRWRLNEQEGMSRWASSKVTVERKGSQWLMRKDAGAKPFESADPDSQRVWWHGTGVHQNLTFPVQPDPISGAHAWHQRVRLEKAHKGDREGDIAADTERSHEMFKEWMERTRPAPGPGGLRRPLWMDRPLKPTPAAFKMEP